MADGQVETDDERIDRILVQLNELTTAFVICYQTEETQYAECRWRGNYLACQKMAEDCSESFSEQINAEYGEDEPEEWEESD